MSTSATLSPNPLPAAPALSQIQRVVATFTAPSRVMSDIARNASWWLPWIVSFIVALLLAFSVDRNIGWKSVIESQIERSPLLTQALNSMPPEKRAQALESQIKTTRITAYAGAVVTPVSYVIIAALLLAIFNFGFGAELKFARAMAITAYSTLVLVVKNLLVAIVAMTGLDPANFNMANPIASNPGHLLSPDANRLLYSALSALDVFALWAIFLMALGISRNSKVKTRTAFCAIFVLYFLVRFGFGALGLA